MTKTKLWLALKTLFAVVVSVTAFTPFCYLIYLSLWSPTGDYFFQGYYESLLASPLYLLRFWKSILLCACMIAGNIVVSVLGGFGFAKFRFRGKNVLFFFLLIIMILPLQVTLVPNFIVLNELHLRSTPWALILPTVFSPLGTFLMTQSFKAVPDVLLEAASLDGANLIEGLTRILLPMNKSGIVCVILLSFIDSWNMVEQPIAYLKDFSQYPFVVALSLVPPNKHIVQLACCVLALLPPLFLFARFSQELVDGITLAKVK